MNTSQPVVSATNLVGGLPNETIKQRDHAMSHLLRTLGFPDLADLYAPRPGKFVADKIHKLNVPHNEDFNQEQNNDR